MNLEKYASLAFFGGLCPGDLEVLGPFFTHQAWVAGTVVFDQGDRAGFLYLVVRGEVTIRYKPEDGPAMILTRVEPGCLFGWSAAMGNPTYTSGAVCALDCEILRIRGEDLRLVCERHPRLGKVLLDRLSAIVAERRKIRQGQVTSLLANGMRQQPKP
jgi:CRP-like cAMP-binding protein